jgi:4-amino-4-deoxy-L-arabinose transferase-like glycosyltransferase
VKRPSSAALLLALIPFIAMCFSVPFWDRIHPLLLGLPFNMLWLIVWIVLSSLCMWFAYRIETARDAPAGRDR